LLLFTAPWAIRELTITRPSCRTRALSWRRRPMSSRLDAARMNCYAAFAQAQQLENEGDNDAALAAYTELVRAARAAHSSTLTYDEKSGPGVYAEIIDSVPPTALVVSVALNSLGGLLLDARKLSDASVAFEDSLTVWGANGMALINLGDLEREHGNFETGFVHYQKAAELPPLGDGDDADDAGGRASDSDEVQDEQGEEEEEEEEESDWFASFVVGPRLECVAQASYMCALMLHQLDRGPEVSRE
jgi:tetratricopeptide (TPR) repeat protein